MKRIAAIVEGYGDGLAVPNLLSKLGDHFDQQIFAPNPIRAGEWKKLRRPGELERALELANSRGYEEILIILDLEDDCAASEFACAKKRIDDWKNGRSVVANLVFIVREYESLFLSCAELFVAGAQTAPDIIAAAELVRDAKGKLKEMTGRRYKETQDQVDYTKMLDISLLVERSRCFRKLAKDVIGVSYEEMRSNSSYPA